MLQNTAYLLEQMQTYFPHLLPIRANDLSNTVYFRRPGDRIVNKYTLATMRLETDQQKQDYAHVMVMPHVDRRVLTEFLTDLEQDAGS